MTQGFIDEPTAHTVTQLGNGSGVQTQALLTGAYALIKAGFKVG